MVRRAAAHGFARAFALVLSARERFYSERGVVVRRDLGEQSRDGLLYIVRNVAAGSFSKRYGVKEGTPLLSTGFEFSYKNDDLGDPMINDWYALALGLATKEEIDTIQKTAFKVNEVLKEYFKHLGVDLIDFKLEFGRYDGRIILADEISPDTCRFWDSKTGEKLDKDRFRRDMGGVEDAYKEMMRRITEDKK